jgi:hypothetical protein
VIKERLSRLFEGYDLAVQTVIGSVLLIEQEHISMKRPHVKDEIDFVVNLIANKELKRAEGEGVSEE